jgi:hypothetical protein
VASRLDDLDVAAIQRQSKIVVAVVLLLAMALAAFVAWEIATYPELPIRLLHAIL